MVMTLAEKILARAAGRESVKPGEVVTAKIDIAMSHENADVVLRAFKEIGIGKVWDPDRIVILFDHRIPAESEKTAATHQRIRDFVKEQRIKHFYDLKEGICHQILPEHGHSRPGDVMVGTDSHTTTHGAYGTFATGIGATEMAGVWTTGELWFMVPETMKINVSGKFREHVSAKDLILSIIGRISASGADYRAVEFTGKTISNMSLASRMVLTNLSMEMGAKVALVAPDAKTIAYVKNHTRMEFEPQLPDSDAEYIEEMDFDVSSLPSMVACPHTVDNVKAVADIAGTRIDQALIGSCTNGRLEDLATASRILEGKKVSQDVRLLVIPASRRVYLEAMQKGYIEIFIRAGGLVLNPGCGPCLGAHQGLMAPGEVCISTTNRNFKGRMGSSESFIYLASPATVAASALTGVITAPDMPAP
ncbi:MAG: 3-isopropylmalate dehydratase large subunit [candidate division WOR-3 bacterium]|nr:MAG: 3-isopropylmalate dehydratase large subunit [candidate division WOR-3 bacterium]